MLARRLLLLTVAAGVMYAAMSATPVPPLAQQPGPSKAVDLSKTPEPKVDNKLGASDRTDAAIATMIVHESRNAYYASGHPCACPEDLMRNGRRCGGTSAYIRPGGAHPLCSTSDFSPDMIRQSQARSGRN